MKEKIFLLGSIFKPLIFKVDNAKLLHYWVTALSTQHHPLFVFNGYLFIYFYFIFNFTILYWFCHISTWIRHRYTHVPHSEPSFLLPPHTIPLGHPSAPTPSIQYCALNLDWWLILYMLLYMFQCHSPKSSHPLPLPQSPKVLSQLFHSRLSLSSRGFLVPLHFLP